MLYADDLKLFTAVRDLKDCIDLQNDLNEMYKWCELNKLSLNLNKCNCITFSRKRRPILVNYYLNSIIVNRVSLINDLGVKFDSKLNFKQHILYISSKARKTWGLIIRHCKTFSVYCTKILFCSLVRSVLEYASVIWSPHFAGDIQIIEKVQNRFLRFTEWKLNIKHVYGSYRFILVHLNMIPLQQRRIFNDLFTLFKILNQNLYSELLLDQIEFYVPYNLRITRENPLFKIPFKGKSYTKNMPIVRFVTLGNEYLCFQDLNRTTNSFKLVLRSLLQNVNINDFE